jgi:hypothetical protein
MAGHASEVALFAWVRVEDIETLKARGRDCNRELVRAELGDIQGHKDLFDVGRSENAQVMSSQGCKETRALVKDSQSFKVRDKLMSPWGGIFEDFVIACACRDAKRDLSLYVAEHGCQDKSMVPGMGSHGLVPSEPANAELSGAGGHAPVSENFSIGNRFGHKAIRVLSGRGTVHGNSSNATNCGIKQGELPGGAQEGFQS